MVTTLSLGPAILRLPQPRSGVSWAIGFSVLLHVALGWYFISRLMIEPALRPDDPISIMIEPVAPPPKREQPKIETDPPKMERQKPRVPVRMPERVFPNPAVPELPFEPAPVEVPGPVTPEPAQAIPAAAPKPTRRVQPVYPDKAAEAGKSGEVEVYLSVSPGGAVSDVQVIREEPRGYGFGRAAATAVKRWEFADAAPGLYRVTVKFRMDD